MQTGLEGKPWYFGLLGGLVVAAILIGLGYQVKVKGLKEEIARQDKQLAKLEARIQEGEAAQKQLPEFQEMVRRLEADLEKLLRILPDKRAVHDLIRQFRAVAEREDFDLIRFQPGREVEKEFFNEWPMQLSVRGSYHALARFFDRMSRFSRIINIDQLRVQGNRRGNTDPTRTIEANFTAKTFVYKEDEGAADAAGGGG